MAKVYKVVDPLQPGTSDNQCITIDWNKCVLCQIETSESLPCPASSKRNTKGAGYKTMAKNLQEFGEAQLLAKNNKFVSFG